MFDQCFMRHIDGKYHSTTALLVLFARKTLRDGKNFTSTKSNKITTSIEVDLFIGLNPDGNLSEIEAHLAPISQQIAEVTKLIRHLISDD